LFQTSNCWQYSNIVRHLPASEPIADTAEAGLRLTRVVMGPLLVLLVI